MEAAAAQDGDPQLVSAALASRFGGGLVARLAASKVSPAFLQADCPTRRGPPPAAASLPPGSCLLPSPLPAARAHCFPTLHMLTPLKPTPHQAGAAKPAGQRRVQRRDGQL